ncbi:type 2 lanthipeptide synthetase LanM family protein [Clostridium cellulovorans]|uniref:Lanthionine synthetase C family protein n=1 Tax=Clostridium cellulovorans (strain ATCC 35296 / DSM 3052 / OCM 3 / 743B) TaxID=573061 RepID=D9SSP8_CLOC7|nr:type 2 lanthipeptide synthetase LanM family protein [Clostridium cellulovorans]ADL50645.1 Lanthionine synthetase C family protein [Clostridium cellulovorans 743B]
MNNVKQLNINMKSFTQTLTIEERLNAFKENQLTTIEDTIILDEKWLNIRSLVSPQVFIEELEHMDIKKEELAFALKSFTDDEENILIEYLEKLDWFKLYKDLMKQFETIYQNEPVFCEQLVLPFKLFVKKELYNVKNDLKNIKIEADLIEKLIDSIVSQLDKLTWKCLIVEITDYKEENILEGKDGRDRYLNFLELCYKSPTQIQLFYDKYPVLGRFVTQKMLDLLTSVKDMILDLDVNFVGINELFNIGTNNIRDIKVSLGDTHQQGKSVAEIQFDNEKKYIYKPRNSYIEKAFNKFIEFANKNSGLKDLFINIVFYAKTFTIEQFIEMQSCKTIVEVKDYYYRFGMLTALISLLSGSDMHFENLIAHNQYPCIIDFETFFTQVNFTHNIDDANVKVIDTQVLNLSGTGLLPMSFPMGHEGDGIDISALSGGNTKPITRKILIAKNVHTDDMGFEYENSYILNQNNNRSTLNGEFQEYKNFKGYIYNGFNDTLDWILKNIDELKVFIKETFNDLQVRQVMKATAIYNNLVDYMDHPHYLNDMARIEKLLENNWAYLYSDKRLVKYEIMDMLHLEIPIFYTSTSKTYLKTSNGAYISDYFKEDVLSKVINTISNLTKEIAEKEQMKLCILLGDYSILVNERKKELAKEISKSNLRIYQDEEVIEVCNSIAEKIMQGAVITEKSISWEYIDDTEEISKFTYLNNGLYSGRSGILLYFYYLNSIQKNEDIENFTKGLIRDVRYYKEPVENTVFKGGAGSLYTLLKCDKDNNFKMIQDTIIFINKDNMKMDKIHWLDGVSSLIKVIDNINKTKYKSDLVLKVADGVIESICNNLDNQIVNTCSVGFGHGLIGILYALLVGQLLLKKDYNVEIEKILALCEEQIHNLKAPKLLDTSKDILSWSNGIVGLGIGALGCKKYTEDSRLDNYINLTIDAIKDYSFDEMSLSNGLAGELDFLASLSLIKDDPLIKEMILMKRNQMLDFYKRNGVFLIDELIQFRNYGLFSGLSGIGYSMLRTLFPDKIPSVLTLD